MLVRTGGKRLACSAAAAAITRRSPVRPSLAVAALSSLCHAVVRHVVKPAPWIGQRNKITAVGLLCRHCHSTAPSQAETSAQIMDAYYNAGAREVFVGAVDAARQCKDQVVESEHLMKALLEPKDGMAWRFLSKIERFDYNDALRYINRFIAFSPKVIAFSPKATDDIDSGSIVGSSLTNLLDNANQHKKDMCDEFLSVEHFLLASFSDERFGEELFTYLCIYDEKELRDAIMDARGCPRVLDQNPEENYEALNEYGHYLSKGPKYELDQRNIRHGDVVQRCIEIISRRTKNYPVVIGGADEGIHDVTRGLADRIGRGDVPEPLLNTKIFSLDTGTARKKYHDDFEERFKAVLKEVAASTIFLINGTTSEATNDANMLQSMIDRGEIHCIMKATFTDYKKCIEKNPTLERRFQQGYCDRVSDGDIMSTLREQRGSLELKYGLTIPDSLLVPAAVLSGRYLTERLLVDDHKVITEWSLPDKAVFLIQIAAQTHAEEIVERPSHRRYEKREKHSLENDNADTLKESARKHHRPCDLLDRIETIKVERMMLGTSHPCDLTRAELQIRFMFLQKQLEEAQRNLAELQESCEYVLTDDITDLDVTKALSELTDIPISDLQQSETDKLVALEEALCKRVAGQDVAVGSVADAIRRSRAGLSDPNRPVASFMFMGPAGAGKTELAKALAVCLFNSEKALVRVDMGEYMDKHAVAEAVRRNPHSVVLFEGIERAHHDVFGFLLQLLDVGRVANSHGRSVSFANCVVIMTSNVGSHYIPGTLRNNTHGILTRKRNACGMKEAVYELMKAQVMELARRTFRPAFMNMIDEYIVFQPVEANEINRIVEIQFDRAKLETEAVAGEHDFTHAAELKYWTLVAIQHELEEAERNLAESQQLMQARAFGGDHRPAYC